MSFLTEEGGVQNGEEQVVTTTGSDNPQPSTTEEQSSLQDQGQHDDKQWRSPFPKELKESPILDKYDAQGKSALPAFYKDAIEALGRTGGVEIPKEDDSAGWDALYTQLGRPESAEKYSSTAKLPVKDSTFEKELRDIAFTAGLSQKQYDSLFSMMVQRQTTELDALKARRAAAHDQCVQSLKTTWGESYEENRNLMTRGLKAVADEKQIHKLEQLGIADDPDVAMIFHKVGSLVQEDGNPGGSHSSSQESAYTSRYPSMKKKK